MFKVTFTAGETVLEQDSLPTDDDCLYMLDTGEVDIVIAGSGEAANTNQEERKVLLHHLSSIVVILYLYHASFRLMLFYKLLTLRATAKALPFQGVPLLSISSFLLSN